MTNPWSPNEHIVNGTFATHDDFVGAIDELRFCTGSPVIVATFSGRWLINSLSRARSDDEGWDEEVVSWLHDELYKRIEPASDKFGLVAARVTDALARAGCSDPVTKGFGSNLERAGRLGVVIGASRRLQEDEAERKAEFVAACVLASRPAAFTVDTSLELAVLSESREAAERLRPRLPSLPESTGAEETEALLKYASELLGTWAVVAYEAGHDIPHRFDHLDRRALSLSASDEPPEWLPSTVKLTYRDDIPAPPELGGSWFDTLGELVDHCFSSKDRPRRLVAHIASDYHAYGVPYGFDDVRRRAIGVLCAIWQARDDRDLGAYEIAASRMVALQLARGYENRHSTGAVRLVTSQLSDISNLKTTPQVDPLIGCDEILLPRLDVGLIATPVSQIVRGLVNLSGAMSVTCRLITGAADGSHLARYLARLHCEGDKCALDSPRRLPIADGANSANAWVATSGKRIYLRTLNRQGDTHYFTSPDLGSYEGLERVSIYREGVECELCVPIFAEGRLVGTVNLEADWPKAFDAIAETVREYAQLIGIVLLESRRRIGVDTVTEAGGFLDHRHGLESKLRELARKLGGDPALSTNRRDHYAAQVKTVQDLVFMRRLPTLDDFPEGARISDVITAAMASVGWTDLDTRMPDLSLEPWSEEADAVFEARVGPDAAKALSFAIAQALHNVRNHGGSGDALAGRAHSAMFRFGETQLGGQRNLYVAVCSTCRPAKFKGIDPQRVFREPIEKDGSRVSLGAFLSGEALRRCGGSAYLRLEHSRVHDATVDAEFSVPALRTRFSRESSGTSPEGRELESSARE